MYSDSIQRPSLVIQLSIFLESDDKRNINSRVTIPADAAVKIEWGKIKADRITLSKQLILE